MQNKDEQYFLQTYHRHKDMVYRIAYTYVRNPDDAKDILQDVFLKLYNTRKSFVDDDHLKHWLIRVAINDSKDYVTSTWFRERNELIESGTYGTVSESGYNEILEEVRRLPVKYRAVIYLHYYEGYSYKEIAEILNLRPSAVKMRAKRGREMLKLNLTVDSIERSME
ncbi:MAG: RNA polymerase sigma factor [Lachnospiraceae bacterium]|nr:RNA polymerase sigma factor [Lachnospiraceae bacterium]